MRFMVKDDFPKELLSFDLRKEVDLIKRSQKTNLLRGVVLTFSFLFLLAIYLIV